MGLNPLSLALLVALGVGLPLNFVSSAWAVRPCGDLVRDLRGSLKALSQPPDIQALQVEVSHARDDYNHAINQLSHATQTYEFAMFIHGANQAQIRYCNAHNALVKLGKEKFEILPMEQRYYGEEFGKSISHLKLAGLGNGTPIKYLNAVEVEALRVREHQGRLILPNGTLLNGLHRAEYVMDAAGGIFIMDQRDPKFAKFKHSSLLRGQPAAAAGEITFDELGRIVEINRKSGHYLPGSTNLEQFLSRLQEMGVDLSHAKIVDGVSR